MTDIIQVILADDHGFVRRGIREFLHESGSINVIAEAENGLQALEYVDYYHPDVAILDIQMPSPNGLDVARQLRKRYGENIGILILTAYNDPPYIRAALSAGANGYIMKSADADDLIAAVHDTYEGRRVVTASLLNRVASQPVPESSLRLTERELEVLQMAAQGLTNKAIGFKLSISDRTVQGHLASIYNKLEVTGRTEATLKALSLNLIQGATVE
ncbi:MAG: DNA-binding response regulator [Chloroflexota bacterium]|nr:DNA-binding response regulator [Chloroflexota bacterium]NOG65461.1 response regulator transcription factor [Chloroflexota bacterium]GIK64377.1 MAG: DNA-binding response regulator [Chloroflexota bacterium]